MGWLGVIGFNGAPNRIRTCDLCLRRTAFYPISQSNCALQSICKSVWRLCEDDFLTFFSVNNQFYPHKHQSLSTAKPLKNGVFLRYIAPAFLMELCLSKSGFYRSFRTRNENAVSHTKWDREPTSHSQTVTEIYKWEMGYQRSRLY